jgi:hypothetical protein
VISFFHRNDAGFATSTEAELGDNFLRAFEQRDQALLENTARDQHITFLDNDIAKLARVLTVPGEVLSSVRPQQREMENRPLQYNNQAYQQQPTPPPPQQSPYHSPPPSNNYQQPDNRGYPSYQYEEDDEDSGLR